MASLGLSALLLIILEITICGTIIVFVPYTEIDWRAYMEEVSGFLAGELNYTNLRGGTGPLVYPAGFTYLYSALYFLTDSGTNILTAQVIFATIYVTTLFVVLALYATAASSKGQGSLPVWVPFLLAASKRVHSLYMLRMFNDTLAMLFLYIAVLMIVRRRWLTGCLTYSFAFSIKMNVALFSPALLLLLLANHSIPKVIFYIVAMGGLQLLLGLPFLLHAPVAYLTRAFELSRVFTYKWTVNFRFLDESTFQSKPMAVLLIILTLLSWGILSRRWWSKKGRFSEADTVALFFEFNVVAVAFSRTLHY